nr:unnamed protein product [Trichobilharzia regenti]
MRITLTLLGMAPISRYIESIVAIKRMISLEKQYMSETIALVKEVQQPSNLPSGSLLSVPITNNQLSQQKKTTDISSNPSRMRQLDAGIQRVRRIRRQFCRTEHDAAYVALASGVVGAGPYAIAQGILFYRRETLRFMMTLDTKIVLLICAVFSMLWISTSFTHFYPAEYQQSELKFERGIGQVHVAGLILLFFTHLIHITLRCFSIALFTGRFYAIILAVLGGHFIIVLISIIVARVYTGRYDSIERSGREQRGDVCGNFLSDLIHCYISLFEFINAEVKYTRTRYLIYYFLYYLENSVMIGLWYDYYEYPESWYYLPCLLVVILVQLLGFILLQVYLYVYSKSRRKTTLCGLCMAHKDIDTIEHNDGGKFKNEQFYNGLTNWNQSQSILTNTTHRTLEKQRSGSILNYYPSMNSLSYATTRTLPKRAYNNNSGTCDPVFGEQISQSAAPLKSKVAKGNKRYKTDLQKSIEHEKQAQQYLQQQQQQQRNRPPSEMSQSQYYYSKPPPTSTTTAGGEMKRRRYLSESRQETQSNGQTRSRQRPVSYNTRPPSSNLSHTTEHSKRISRTNSYLLQENSSKPSNNDQYSFSQQPQTVLTKQNPIKLEKGVYRPKSNHHSVSNITQNRMKTKTTSRE